MPSLRIVADDLTGALDTAAEFTGLAGAVDVRWDGDFGPPRQACLAMDSGTRDMAPEQVVARISAIAPLMAEAEISYKKIDSLLRGHVMDEVAACMRLGLWDACIIAPAFPFQGRITRGSIQYRQISSSGWEAVGDLPALAQASGLSARRGDLSVPLSAGIHIFDAESDEELTRIAQLGRAASGRVLWCGAAGLAQALCPGAKVAARSFPAPVLGLFGSDQPTTMRQLAACGAYSTGYSPADASGAERLAQALERRGVALAGFDLPGSISRQDAARRIAAGLRVLIAELPRPGTLLAAGGETLRAICDIVGANTLRTIGRIEPGLPRSILFGGVWDGVPVVSKSGAFGSDDLWSDLLRFNGFHVERIQA